MTREQLQGTKGVRIITSSSDTVELSQVELRQDSIEGLVRDGARKRTSVAVTDIDRLQLLTFDSLRTAREVVFWTGTTILIGLATLFGAYLLFGPST